jgi:pyrroline-5-carboxylate reductase
MKEKIAFIGGGNMAEALIKGIAARYQDRITVSEPSEERRKHLEGLFGVKTTASNAEAVEGAQIIILAVKPQVMELVLKEISPFVEGSKTVVSIAAGISLSYLAERLRTGKLVRVMPNTAALVGEAMSVLSLCECLHEKDFEAVKDIFMSIGKAVVMPEKYMDAVTAISGSGPAFVALFLEGLMEGGQAAGLAAGAARELVVQTALGTARLLEETGLDTVELRRMVTSPGGTTMAGLKIFEEAGLKGIILDAVVAAVKRAEELGKG